MGTGALLQTTNTDFSGALLNAVKNPGPARGSPQPLPCPLSPGRGRAPCAPPCRTFQGASLRALFPCHAAVASLPEEEEEDGGFLFFLPSLLFFFRNGILKQPATKANSRDNSLNNLHNARLERT